MKELLRKIRQEEATGNITTFDDLSEELRKEIEEKIIPQTIAKGLERIKLFLSGFK